MSKKSETPSYKVAIVIDFSDTDVKQLVCTLKEAFPNHIIYCLDKTISKDIELVPHSKLVSKTFFGFLKPLAFEKIKFHQDTKLIISISNDFAKFIIPPVGVKHIAYINKVPRQIWRRDQSKSKFATVIENIFPLSSFKIADYLNTRRIHLLIASSEHEQERIRKFYRRDSIVMQLTKIKQKKTKNMLKYDRKAFITKIREIATEYKT